VKLDFRVDAHWRDDPKSQHLFETLGPDGVIALFTLWGFARVQRTRGVLHGMKAPDIAKAARFEGNALHFIRALKSTGFLDSVEGQYELHEWEKHQPYSYHSEDRSDAASRASAQRWGKRCKELSDAPPPIPNPNPKPSPSPVPTHNLDSSNCSDLSVFQEQETAPHTTDRLFGTAVKKAVCPRSIGETLDELIGSLECKSPRTEFEEKELDGLKNRRNRSQQENKTNEVGRESGSQGSLEENGHSLNF